MSYFQVHFTPLPSAKKKHYIAIQGAITECLQEMVRRGTLLFSGRYTASIGSEWLVKARNRHEVERLAMDHPAVKCNLITYRISELIDTIGVLSREEVAPPVEPAKS
jgi:hypothetical protein